MNKQQLERANELSESRECIKTLFGLVGYPYPKMYCDSKTIKAQIIKGLDKHTGFCYDGEVVSFISLDEQTRTELKDAIHEVLMKRLEEIDKEFNAL